MKPVFRALILLLVVVGAGVLVRQIPLAPTTGAPRGLVETGTSLGVLLLGAWLAGIVFASINLPRITGYIAFGVLVGPDVLGVVTRDQTPYLRLVNDLAIAIIALTAGGEIHLEFLKKGARSIASITLIQSVIVLVAVALAAYFAPSALAITDFTDAGDKWMIAAIVAVIAVASSPSVVIAILTETRAKGPLSQTTLASVVAKDLVLIVLFTIVMTLGARHFAEAMSASGSDDDHHQAGVLLTLVHHLGGSVVAGLLTGGLMSWYVHRVKTNMPIFVVLASLGLALLTEQLALEPLIVALVAGMMLRNVWHEETESLFETVEELSLPVYAAFFAFAGSKLELTGIGSILPAAALIVAVRLGATWLGTWLGAKVGRSPEVVGRFGWTGFVSQAGVALALAAIIQRTFGDAEFASILYNLILAMIAMQEILGPILFRWGLTRAGEVEGASARSGDEPTADDALQTPGPRGAP
jgi:Kef-type K+ transport system membrane component KefB